MSDPTFTTNRKPTTARLEEIKEIELINKAYKTAPKTLKKAGQSRNPYARVAFTSTPHPKIKMSVYMTKSDTKPRISRPVAGSEVSEVRIAKCADDLKHFLTSLSLSKGTMLSAKVKKDQQQFDV